MSARARPALLPLIAGLLLLGGCATQAASGGARYDVLIRGGTVVDGSGGTPVVADVAITGDRVARIGRNLGGTAARTIDATGLTVAPGFVNMLSWAVDSLIADGAGESDIRQGVTTEIFGEGTSYGPLTEAMRADMVKAQDEIRYPVSWTTLAEYLRFLQTRGVAPNVASFVGAATVRIHELGEGDVDPSPAQLAAMQALVRQAMNEGALGVGSSLIYAPGTFAETPELVALAKASAECGGMYISHLRSESDDLLKAVDELIAIARESGGPAEIYHLKQAGRTNWDKLDTVIARIEAARAAGVRITADMYTYTAGATGLDAAMPTWVQAGGYEAWRTRLQDPAIRRRVIAEMKARPVGFDNLYWHAGPDKTLLLGFHNPDLRRLSGMTVAGVAKMRGATPEDTIIDLVIEDGSRVQVAYELMSEANVARQAALPWMSFGSDEGAEAPRGPFLQFRPHPRAYGNFARVLGQYTRDEKRMPIQDAVRRLSALPAANLGLKDRGLLRPGMKADVAIFDAATIGDRATFDQPQRFAVGMRHVLVNGAPVLLDGMMTGARPGRALDGPGTGKCPAK